MKKTLLTILCFWMAASSFLFAQQTPKPNPNRNLVRVNILQINDVYEITPIAGYGGIARFATLKKHLKRETANTLSILAGDFFSPSALGTAKVNGERLNGKQMVAMLNYAGLDYATFGNHEFDLKEDQFRARMSETRFKWVSSNVYEANGSAYQGVYPSAAYEASNALGRRFRIGIIAVTLDKNRKPFVKYEDVMQAAKREIEKLRPQVQMMIAITHLELADDIKLAEAFPELALIMGGHEHENILVRRGANLTKISKADANARSAWIHRITYNTASKKYSISSELKYLDNTVEEDPATAAEANRWVQMAYAGFRAEGFNPDKVVTNTTEALDGREASIRNFPTVLGSRIAEAMFRAVPNAQAAIFNGGSVRIDDVLLPGAVTEYDVIRVLPFGGQAVATTMRGSLLKKVLIQGLANRNKGGYLHWHNITQQGDTFLVGGEAINDDQTYTIATSDFLVSGAEGGLDYLKEGNPDLTIGEKVGDVRRLFINELQRVYGVGN